MPVTRRGFLRYCAICGVALGVPGCRHRYHHPPVCPPCPTLFTPPRGLDPPRPAQGQLPPWPVDPDFNARKEQLRKDWLTRPKPARQDGFWPYLLIRAFRDDRGARPVNPGLSPDIMVAEGFPVPPANWFTSFCHMDSPKTIHVRVWNLGQLAAFGVALRVYSGWSSDVSGSFQNYHLIGGTYLNLHDRTSRSCTQLVQLPVPWVPGQNISPTAQSWGLLAIATAVTDPADSVPPAVVDLHNDRHVASLFFTKEWSAQDEGDLFTNDRVDRIHYRIEHGTVAADTISVRLSNPANAPTSKALTVFDHATGRKWGTPSPIAPGDVREELVPAATISENLFFELGKVESPGGVNIFELRGSDCLNGGDRVNFTWTAG
jgi:hypothetical protein